MLRFFLFLWKKHFAKSWSENCWLFRFFNCYAYIANLYTLVLQPAKSNPCRKNENFLHLYYYFAQLLNIFFSIKKTTKQSQHCSKYHIRSGNAEKKSVIIAYFDVFFNRMFWPNYVIFILPPIHSYYNIKLRFRQILKKKIKSIINNEMKWKWQWNAIQCLRPGTFSTYIQTNSTLMHPWSYSMSLATACFEGYVYYQEVKFKFGLCGRRQLQSKECTFWNDVRSIIIYGTPCASTSKSQCPLLVY